MVKILSQSGISLADTYDVEGSIAGVEQLEAREVSLVHEMGRTIFSERFSTIIRRVTTGDILQDVNFDATLADLPGVPSRLLGVVLFSDAAVRILNVVVSLQNALGTVREFPVWVWDQSNFLTARMVDDGSGVTVFQVLRGQPELSMLPSFAGGTDQPQIVDRIAMRGRTAGFGAGTVFIRALYYIGFAQIAGVSSHGLPIPSW